MGEVTNVARFLPLRAADQPDQPAILAPNGNGYNRRTFRELEADSNAAARLMQAQGITQGTRTLVMVRPGLDLIACAFALFKLGAVPLLIDPGMGLKNFLKCVGRSEPEALVGIAQAQIVAKVARKSFAHTRIRVRVGGREWQQNLSQYQAGDPVLAATQADDLAAVLFTSGSTGAPKGVCYTHGMFEAQVELIRERFQIEPGEVDLPMLPIFALFNPALGMTTIVPQMNPSRPATVDPQSIVQAIVANGVTNSFGSPVLWRKIIGHCESTGTQLPTVRRILMAGAPVPPALLERFAGVFPNGQAYSPYGATECLPVTAISAAEVLGETREKTETGWGTCVGSPLPGVQVRILRLTEGVIDKSLSELELPQGEIGEIVVTGPTVTREYDRLPDATALAKIQVEGITWHRMGDLGWLDTQGRLWFCGRVAERVRLPGGAFLCTEKVEPVFNRVPGVHRTALIGLPGQAGETPALVVELDGNRLPGKKERQAWITKLQEAAKDHPDAAQVQRFFFHKSFPVDVRHNAKIHRLTLREWALKLTTPERP